MIIKQNFILTYIAISTTLNGFLFFKLDELKTQFVSRENLISSLTKKATDALAAQKIQKVLAVTEPSVIVSEPLLNQTVSVVVPLFLGLLACVVAYSVICITVNSAAPAIDSLVTKVAKNFGIYNNDHSFIIYESDRITKMGELSFTSSIVKSEGLTNIQYLSSKSGELVSFVSEEAFHQSFIAAAAVAKIHHGPSGDIILSLSHIIIN